MRRERRIAKVSVGRRGKLTQCHRVREEERRAHMCVCRVDDERMHVHATLVASHRVVSSLSCSCTSPRAPEVSWKRSLFPLPYTTKSAVPGMDVYWVFRKCTSVVKPETGKPLPRARCKMRQENETARERETEKVRLKYLKI